MSDVDLCYTPATELLALIRAKKLSPVELTRAVLARIDTLNPTLNAFVTPTPEIALADARRAEEAVMKGGALGAPPRAWPASAGVPPAGSAGAPAPFWPAAGRRSARIQVPVPPDGRRRRRGAVAPPP